MAAAEKQTAPTAVPSSAEKIIEFEPENVAAPFFLRLCALFIDYMVVIALPVLWLATGRILTDVGTTVVIGSWIWTISVIIALTDLVVLPIFIGKSFGKLLMGLTILNVDGTHTGPVGILLRNVVGYLVTLLTLGLGFLLAAVNGSGRSLHDFIGGTIVVRARKIPV
jgi:uncharacterized RDD family membrane protein YckC